MFTASGITGINNSVKDLCSGEENPDFTDQWEEYWRDGRSLAVDGLHLKVISAAQ